MNDSSGPPAQRKRSHRMMGLAHRRRGAVLAGVVAIVLTIVAAGPAQAAVTPNYGTGDKCGIATVIQVRGTGEPGGTGFKDGGRIYASGGVGPRLLNFALAHDNDQEIPVFEEDLLYPAADFTSTSTSTTYIYDQSVATGVTNLRGEIEYLAAACPFTNILLAGYSQGAQVIGDVIDTTKPIQLSAAAKNLIGGVMLWGDPTYRPGEVWDAAGNGVGGGFFGMRAPGAFSSYTRTIWPGTQPAPITVSLVKSICFTGDEFCQDQFPFGNPIHTSYNTTSGWAFMRQFLISGN